MKRVGFGRDPAGGVPGDAPHGRGLARRRGRPDRSAPRAHRHRPGGAAGDAPAGGRAVRDGRVLRGDARRGAATRPSAGWPGTAWASRSPSCCCTSIRRRRPSCSSARATGSARSFGGLIYGAIGIGQAVGLRDVPLSPHPAAGHLVVPGCAAQLDRDRVHRRGGVPRRDLRPAALDRAGRDAIANVIQTLLYTLTTRLGAPGRDRYLLVLTLGIGFIGGWLTAFTGGIAAAFLGHAITRFAVFLCTGHTGQTKPRGREVEEIERRHRTPDGWRVIGPRESASRDR